MRTAMLPAGLGTSLALICSLLAGSAGAQEGREESLLVMQGREAREFKLPEDVRLFSERTTAEGLMLERYQQSLGDALVIGAQLSVRRDEKGQAQSVFGRHYTGLEPRNEVKLSQQQAFEQLPEADRSDQGPWEAFLAFDPGEERFVYWFDKPRPGSYWVFWVDAEDGLTRKAIDITPSGWGYGVLGDVKDLTGLTRMDLADDTCMVSVDGRIRTYDAGNTEDVPGVLACHYLDYWTAPRHPPIVDAQFYGNWADGYLSAVHGFDFRAYYPEGVQLVTHYGDEVAGAYWDLALGMAVFGDGDADTPDPHLLALSGSLEVVGHELGHAVIDKIVTGAGGEQGLLYEHESGALDEAFADILGTAMEYYYAPWLPAGQVPDWTIGEDIGLPPGDPYLHRSMEDPNQVSYQGCQHPSHYGDILRTAIPQKSNDWGLVHENSGIINHWFYLLVEGGLNAKPGCRGSSPVPGIHDVQQAAALVFRAFEHLTTTATLCEARQVTLSNAGAYAGSVAAAWDEVGVTQRLCDGPALAIDFPAQDAVIGGPDEVQLQGWAADVGGLKLDRNDNADVSLWIRPVGAPDFQPLRTSWFQYGVARPDVCPANPAEPTPACDYDFEVACRIDTDPHCPNVGWRASFDTLDYPDGDYILRLEARSYQTTTWIDRRVTIDNSRVYDLALDPVFDTYVSEAAPDQAYCDQTILRVRGQAGYRNETYLHFQVPCFPGTLYSTKLALRAGGATSGLEIWLVDSKERWSSCYPTWNDPPQGQRALLAVVPSLPSHQRVEVDLTDFIDRPGAYTLQLKLQNASNRWLYSSENADAPPTPQLEIRSANTGQVVQLPFCGPDPLDNLAGENEAAILDGPVTWLPDCDTGGPGAYRFLSNEAEIEVFDGLDHTAALTLEASVRVDGPIPAGGTRMFMLVRRLQGYALFIQPWGGHHFVFWVDAALGGARQVSSPDTLEYGRWYHVVGTYDGLHQRLYVDGQLVDDSTVLRGEVEGAAGPAWIGEGFPSSLDGVIGNVTIYDRALSAGEVWDLYQTTSLDDAGCTPAKPEPPASLSAR